MIEAIEIPKKGLAVRTRLGVAFRAPDGPQGRIITLDSLACGQERLKRGQQLQTFVAVMVLASGEERPQISSLHLRACTGIALDHIGIEEKKDSFPLPIDWI